MLSALSAFPVLTRLSLPSRMAAAVTTPLWHAWKALGGGVTSKSPWEAVHETETAWHVPLPSHHQPQPHHQAALWLAVPKQKVTRHKKRLKTTVQKRIPLRHDIITDPRTGETTLRHKLPFNWKDYLPGQVF
jgi:ribosomal protein L32